MKKYMLFIIPIYLVYVFGYFYVVLPPLNWHAPEFWQFLIFTVGPVSYTHLTLPTKLEV